MFKYYYYYFLFPELLCELSEAVLYLIIPEEAFRCHSLKLILIELLSAVVLHPIINLLSDPDNINRTIIRNVSFIITL